MFKATLLTLDYVLNQAERPWERGQGKNNVMYYIGHTKENWNDTRPPSNGFHFTLIHTNDVQTKPYKVLSHTFVDGNLSLFGDSLSFLIFFFKARLEHYNHPPTAQCLVTKFSSKDWELRSKCPRITSKNSQTPIPSSLFTFSWLAFQLGQETASVIWFSG